MKRAGRLDDVGVEAAAQAAVGGDHEEQRLAAGARLARSSSSGCAAGSTRDARLFSTRSICGRERPRLLDALLRAAQPRRRDHLHGLGDLLRRLDRADPAADVE